MIAHLFREWSESVYASLWWLDRGYPDLFDPNDFLWLEFVVALV